MTPVRAEVRDSLFLRYLALFCVLAQCAKCIGSMAKGLHSLGIAAGSVFGNTALVLVEACHLAVMAYAIPRGWSTPQLAADWLLAISAASSYAFNFTAHYSGTLVGFIVKKNFLAYHSWLSIMVAMMAPPAHAFTHWAITCPAFM